MSDLETEEYRYITNISSLEKFLEDSRLNNLSKTLHVDEWTTVSKLFFYLGIIGAILFTLSIFIQIFWLVCWFFALFIIILLGFIFAKPGEQYNVVLVFGILALLVFIPSFYGQGFLKMVSLETESTSGLSNTFSDLGSMENDLESTVRTFNDALNWVVFIAMITLGGDTIADAYKLDFAGAAKNVAIIATAVAVMSVVYGIFNSMGDMHINTVWDTVGSGYQDLMKSIGLASLDSSGTTVMTPKTVVNGFFDIFPLLLTVMLFGLAFSFRHYDLQSMLFIKQVQRENIITVKRSSFSIGVGIVFFVMSFYLIAYFLITAEPDIVVSLEITLVFYIFAVVVCILIGNGFLIVNRNRDWKSLISSTILWFVLGIVGLWLWFNVIQPIAYSMNLTDRRTSLQVMSQDVLFHSTFFEQLFLVAMPETLVFQIFPIGLANRLYFYFKRTRFQKERKDRLENKIKNLTIILKDIDIDENSISQANLRLITRATAIQKKIYLLEEEIEAMEYTKMPFRDFLFPGLIGSFFGSFFFSWYHSFRRGINFIDWWQNPYLGLTYFGAGMLLCLVAMFSAPAAILVHALNNTIVVMMYS